jgi:hypothetical protein
MFWRPPLKRYRKPWWDTKLARCFGVGNGLAAILWLHHFYPYPHSMAANDMDHVRW